MEGKGLQAHSPAATAKNMEDGRTGVENLNDFQAVRELCA